MTSTGDSAERPTDLPGSKTSGLGSASQLFASTSGFSITVDATTAPHPLLVLPSARIGDGGAQVITPLRADDYPVLAGIWDNDEDDIFDTV